MQRHNPARRSVHGESVSLELIVFEGTVNHRVFVHQFSSDDLGRHRAITFDPAVIYFGAMLAYPSLKKHFAFLREEEWHRLECKSSGIIPLALIPRLVDLIS